MEQYWKETEFAGSVLFFESGLDRDETYQITMKNLDQDLYMDLHQVSLS